jgi:hypothetical protein
VGSPSPLTIVNATGTVTNQLYPGGAGDLLIKLDNPNPYPVTIVSLAPNGASTPSGGLGTCNGNSVEAANLSGLNIAVSAGNNVAVTIGNGAAMTGAALSGCQGASFSVPITITVEK